MQSSFDKVILVHKCITKFPAYSRMQGIFNAFRDKRTKSKPILRYRTSPKECQPENGIFFAITVLKITPRRQPCGDFMLCSNKKYAHFQVRGSFGKVILAHKGITKPPAYSRIQAVFNVFRGKRTKPKPNLLYDGRPKGKPFLFLLTIF